MAAGTTPDKAMLAFDRLIEEGFETYDLLTQTPYFDGIPPAKTKKRKKPSA
jgi:hypothetical protein